MNRAILCFATLIIVISSSPASAGIILVINSGGNETIVIDNAPAGTTSRGGAYTSTVDDVLNTEGDVFFSGGQGNFPVIVASVFSDMSSNKLGLTATIAGVGQLEITAINTDYSMSTSGMIDLKSTIGGTTQQMVSEVSGGLLDSNGETGFPTITTQGPFSRGGFNDHDMGNAFVNSGSFSLSQSVKVNHASYGVSSFDYEIQAISAVPEPTSFLVFGLNLMCLLAMRRR